MNQPSHEEKVRQRMWALIEAGRSHAPSREQERRLLNALYNAEEERAKSTTRRAAWPWNLTWTTAGAMVAVIALFLVLRGSAGEPQVVALAENAATGSALWIGHDVAGIGKIEGSGAKAPQIVEAEGEKRIALGQGQYEMDVQPQEAGRPVVFVTPHFRVVVLGTRLSIGVHGELSLVFLERGSIRVEGPAGASVTLTTGQSIDSADPRLHALAAAPQAPRAPRSQATPEVERTTGRQEKSRGSDVAQNIPAAAPVAIETVEGCQQRPDSADRIACLSRMTEGKDLGAQHALYALGMEYRGSDREKALGFFREVERRFPRGTLAPDAALRTVEVLRAQGKHLEALTMLASYERRYADDPRFGEMLVMQAQILCGSEQRSDEFARWLQEFGQSNEEHARSLAVRIKERCK